MSRNVRLAIGIIGVVLFLALAAYWLLAADGHPRVKHTILFTGLAVLSALFAWFSLPPRELGPDR